MKMCQKHTLEYNTQNFKATVRTKPPAVVQEGESKDNNPVPLTQMQ